MWNRIIQTKTPKPITPSHLIIDYYHLMFPCTKASQKLEICVGKVLTFLLLPLDHEWLFDSLEWYKAELTVSELVWSRQGRWQCLWGQVLPTTAAHAASAFGNIRRGAKRTFHVTAAPCQGNVLWCWYVPDNVVFMLLLPGLEMFTEYSMKCTKNTVGK